VSGKEFVAGLSKVHPSLLLAHEVPQLLPVGPPDFGKRCRPPRVAGFAGGGVCEFPESVESKK